MSKEASSGAAGPRLWIGAAVLGGFALAGIAAWVALEVRAVNRPAPLPEAPPWPVVVSTLAGRGTPGRADGRLSSASFSDPFGIAVDAAGNSYVTDAGDQNLVLKITPDGRVLSIAGGGEGWRDGAGTDARFNTPSGIAVAPDGTLVVADTGNHAIRRVTPDGLVTTIAGGAGPGREDGPAASVRFDGPIGVAVDRNGTIFVADTYNDCIRKISTDGIVSTVAGGLLPGYRNGTGSEARFDTPSGIAVDERGHLFVADTGNDVLREVDPRGDVTTAGFSRQGQPLLDGLSCRSGSRLACRSRPAATCMFPIAWAASCSSSAAAPPGSLPARSPGWRTGLAPRRVFAVPRAWRSIPTAWFVWPTPKTASSACSTPLGAARAVPGIPFSPLPLHALALTGFDRFDWPVASQDAWHEVTATLGEARGSIGGDGRERLHAGIDVYASPGTLVRAVRDGKVARPIAAGGHGSLDEMVRIGPVGYVHVRVGRNLDEGSLDPSRFTILRDADGRAAGLRIRRGTRFRAGDPVGSVNRYAHVHLGVGANAAESNALLLPLPGFADHVPPTISKSGISFFDETGAPLESRRGRVDVSGRVAIVADAWDQVDGNKGRRRLGVYSLGYQVVRPDGRPLPGLERPRMTIRFDRLPETPGAASLVYASGSGITAYGSRATRFLYIVTNEVRDGSARQGWWDTTKLVPGDYAVRVFAEDASGNTAHQDVKVRVTGR